MEVRGSRGGESKVDVLLRDLDVVEYWTRRAQEGEFLAGRAAWLSGRHPTTP